MKQPIRQVETWRKYVRVVPPMKSSSPSMSTIRNHSCALQLPVGRKNCSFRRVCKLNSLRFWLRLRLTSMESMEGENSEGYVSLILYASAITTSRVAWENQPLACVAERVFFCACESFGQTLFTLACVARAPIRFRSKKRGTESSDYSRINL